LRRPILVDICNPIVVNLMIIPGHEPRRRGVRCLQIDIHLVLSVAASIILERVDFLSEMRPYDFNRSAPGIAEAVAAILVDVITIAIDEVWLLGSEMTVCRVVALLVILASSDSKTDIVDRLTDCGGCAASSDRAALTTGNKSIPVRSVRLQAHDFNMNRMAELWTRDGCSACNDITEPGITRHFPLHLHRRGGHAIPNLKWIRGQASPNHEPIRCRLSRGDAQLKRVLPKDG